MAISEAIQAISTEDPASLGTAEPNMHDPPSFAEIAQGRGNRRDFKYLDALSADGPDTPSKMCEVGVHLASNELPPCARKIVFKEENLRGAAGNFLCNGNVRTPSRHDLMVCVQVLHVLALDDHTILGSQSRSEGRRGGGTCWGRGTPGASKGGAGRAGTEQGGVQHVSFCAPNIETAIG